MYIRVVNSMCVDRTIIRFITECLNVGDTLCFSDFSSFAFQIFHHLSCCWTSFHCDSVPVGAVFFEASHWP